MKSTSFKTAKKDGRRNNGGARIGAGRPRKVFDSKYQDDDYYNEPIVVSEMRDCQLRKVKKARFYVMVDEQLKYGAAFKKGHKREFNKLKKIAWATRDSDLRNARLLYITQRSEEEREKQWKIVKARQREPYVPPPSWETNYEIQVRKDRRREALIWKQNRSVAFIVQEKLYQNRLAKEREIDALYYAAYNRVMFYIPGRRLGF